jgi:hypothetical protein
MMILSLTNKGAPVKPTVSLSLSINLVAQFSFPVFASMATSLPSSVPMYTLPAPMAMPRL